MVLLAPVQYGFLMSLNLRPERDDDGRHLKVHAVPA